MVIDLGFSPERVDELLGASDSTLEWFACFALMVAGHKASTTMQCLVRFAEFGPKRDDESPYGYILRLDRENRLEGAVRACGAGNFAKNTKGLRDLANRGVEAIREGTFHSLRTIHGISFKSAAFILSYTRGEKLPVLDVHLLRFLRENGHPDAPTSTPQSAKMYDRWSRAYLDLAERLGVDPVALDLQVWKEYSGYLPA